MKPIPFSYVNTRKLSMQPGPTVHKTSYRTVSNNLNVSNLLLFVESSDKDYDTHFLQSLAFYNRLLSEQNVSDIQKRKIENALINNLPKVNNLGCVHKTVVECDCIDNKVRFIDTLESLDNCDRIIRNENKLLKRFDLNKTINDNIMRGTRHTVFELCSLIDTYSISPKAKLNIALENVSYALFKSGHDIDLNEAVEFIVEYFLTRESVITDKEYAGYVDVLETNRFIDTDKSDVSYVFEAKKEKGNSFKEKASVLITQCETKECATHMSQLHNIKNEKHASKYIDDSIEMIIADNITKNDSLLLLKSIYCIPLIGNVSKEFVDYKVEMSRNKLNIKKKLTGIKNEKIVREILEDSELIDCVEFVSETVHFENYILDDNYVEETDPVKILEASGNTDEIKDIINSFKASNEKSASKFRNMISRIMTKSPENIIDETPNIFSVVRFMIYLAIGASSPIGPIIAIVTMMVGKLLTMHLDLKQAEKLLRHLKSEKEKAEKKLEKLSGKEKQNQEEYIDAIKKCIKKVETFISNIDDENEELNKGNDSDDFDFDFDDDDFDIDLESVIESGSIFNSSITDELMDFLSHPVDEEILANLAVLFDNCEEPVMNEFYNALENIRENYHHKYDSYDLHCYNLIKGKGINKIKGADFTVQYEAMQILNELSKEIKKEKDKGNSTPRININALKMSVVNFKKKFRDLKGKEQELWRNIDIATSQLSRGIQQALTSDRREAIIKGSIIPSFSKCIKFAITVGAIGAFTGPVGAAISAVGMLGASKALNERERRLLYDEIDTELQVVEKQIQMAESEGNMNQYRFLLNYEKKLKREKNRIKYGVKAAGRPIPELKGGKD